MKPERWQQIDRILDGALEREGDQRQAFLEEACSGDPSLRREVESLIEAGERAESFIESPALEQAARTLAQSRGRESLEGQTLGAYRILSFLGRGGMGEVYLAEDTNLPRKVALKFLTEQFTRDEERLSRFRREARLLASLNHVGIAAIHSLEESNGQHFLVLELVEGETLAQRLTRGPLAVEEALRVGRQIAEGLEAAHESGVIHRDLKPANVKITPEGAVKILDFGLAKTVENETSKRELPNSPTLTLEATKEGIVLGTAAYMSPEQARGREVDKRTDIWSFGLVLFEMLTGKRMYAGQSFTETLAAVIHQKPSLEQLPTETPRGIRELLKRCLRKDPRMRLRDIGDARIAIDECLVEGAPSPEETPVPRPALSLWRRMAPWLAVPLLATVGWFARPSPTLPDKPLVRFENRVEKSRVLNHWFRHGIALSPDGRQLAFVSAGNAEWYDTERTIQVRSLDQCEPVVVLQKEGTSFSQPFFSPDGKWLGFNEWHPKPDRPALKKIPLQGGTPVTICAPPANVGASWGSDDQIIFARRGPGGLLRVPAAGGEPEQITELDRETGESSHRLPHVLPGAKAVLFTVLRHQGWSGPQIFVLSLETGERKLLIEDGTDARYVPTGHLVYARQGTLMAVPFDPETLSLDGSPVPVLEGVTHSIDIPNSIANSGAAQFAFSDSGSLAYITGPMWDEIVNPHDPVWVKRDGTEEPIGVEPGYWTYARLSPDGSRVALIKGLESLWTYDLARDTLSIQISQGIVSNPVWSPDGTRIAFNWNRDGPRNLFSKLVDRPGEPVALSPSEHPQRPSSWAREGNKLAFCEMGDIWILPMDGSSSAERFTNTPRIEERFPTFSPDGQWIAYASFVSGRPEVYVQPYPGPGSRQTISTDGGISPAWSGNGKELFYRAGEEGKKLMLMAVDIKVDGGELIPGIPVVLFEGDHSYASHSRTYDVSADGKRFLMIRQPEKNPWGSGLEEFYGDRVNVVLNWFEELKRMVPTDQ